MLHIRRSEERVRSGSGWLRTLHAFSPVEGDAAPAGFRGLRDVEESRGEAGGASETGRRQEEEIITYVVEGALAHNDEMNNGTVVFPGDIHRITAGRGITGREFNHSDAGPVHFIRFRIEPEARDLVPGYEQRMFIPEESLGAVLLLASRDGREHSVKVHRDCELYLATLEPGMEVRHPLAPGHAAWVQVVRGTILLNGQELRAGDGAAVTGEPELLLAGTAAAEVLLADML